MKNIAKMLANAKKIWYNSIRINHTKRVFKEVPVKTGPKKWRTLWKKNKKGGI